MLVVECWLVECWWWSACFAGGMLGYLSKHGNGDKKMALLYASAIASFTVSNFGINNLLNLNFNELDKRVEILSKLIEK